MGTALDWLISTPARSALSLAMSKEPNATGRHFGTINARMLVVFCCAVVLTMPTLSGHVSCRRFPILETLRWRFSDPDWAAAVVRQPRRTDGIVEVPV